MKHKYLVLFFILFLSVGFAGISTKFIVNGNINLAFDDNTFIVVFENASSDNGTPVISNDEKTINFKTNTLKSTSDTAKLEFSIANKSKSYDANVDVTCELKDSSLSQYIDIISNINNPELVEASSKISNTLTINMKQENTQEINPEVVCKLVATPISRSTENEGEFSLNGADPVLDEAEKLVPITIAKDGTVKYANTTKEWYNYSNKEWANAVILVDNPSKEYEVNDVIVEDDIESYFVWIPRYRYQIFDKGEYNSGIESELPTKSNVKEIKIVFEGKDTEVSNGSEVGDWLTHPAFTNYDTNGIWVGKFETGYAGAASTSAAEQNTFDASKVVVKPNVYSWRNITVSNIFKTAASYEESLTSHMMRNTEWGAVAYLSHSKYGINDEVRINNNSNYLTGYAANTKDAGSSTTNNSKYNTETGYLASTTGNITGVYDMSGSAWEYVAGYRANTPGSSGFSTTELTTYAAHLDVYNANSSVNSYNYRILGDATGEMGPFHSGYINNWYGDYSNFVESTYPWFFRGGYYNDGSSAGQFGFSRSTGGAGSARSFRLVLAFEK